MNVSGGVSDYDILTENYNPSVLLQLWVSKVVLKFIYVLGLGVVLIPGRRAFSRLLAFRRAKGDVEKVRYCSRTSKVEDVGRP